MNATSYLSLEESDLNRTKALVNSLSRVLKRRLNHYHSEDASIQNTIESIQNNIGYIEESFKGKIRIKHWLPKTLPTVMASSITEEPQPDATLTWIYLNLATESMTSKEAIISSLNNAIESTVTKKANSSTTAPTIVISLDKAPELDNFSRLLIGQFKKRCSILILRENTLSFDLADYPCQSQQNIEITSLVLVSLFSQYIGVILTQLENSSVEVDLPSIADSLKNLV